VVSRGRCYSGEGGSWPWVGGGLASIRRCLVISIARVGRCAASTVADADFMDQKNIAVLFVIQLWKPFGFVNDGAQSVELTHIEYGRSINMLGVHHLSNPL